MGDEFNDWANSIAALAVCKPADRLRMIQVNEAATARAMRAWEAGNYKMVKPQRIWIGEK